MANAGWRQNLQRGSSPRSSPAWCSLGAAWTLIASLVFLFGTRLIGSFAHPFYQWWSYFLFAPPNRRGDALAQDRRRGGLGRRCWCSPLALAFRRRTVGPSLRRGLFGGTPLPMRGATDNHGHADWLSIAKARDVFPGPRPIFGGLRRRGSLPGGRGQSRGRGVRPGQQGDLGKGRQGPAAHRSLQVRPHPQPDLRRGGIVQIHVRRLDTADLDRLRCRAGSVLRAWPHAGRRA